MTRSSMPRCIPAAPFVAAVLLSLVCLSAGSIVLGQRETPRPGQVTPAPPPVSDAEKKPEPADKKRLRENTAFQGQAALFRSVGNRTSVFLLPSNERFTCLENLCLERVLQVMEEHPEEVHWRIDGLYTEFRGENYVLLRRAVLAPGADMPTTTTSPTTSPMRTPAPTTPRT